MGILAPSLFSIKPSPNRVKHDLTLLVGLIQDHGWINFQT